MGSVTKFTLQVAENSTVGTVNLYINSTQFGLNNFTIVTGGPATTPGATYWFNFTSLVFASAAAVDFTKGKPPQLLHALLLNSKQQLAASLCNVPLCTGHNHLTAFPLAHFSSVSVYRAVPTPFPVCAILAVQIGYSIAFTLTSQSGRSTNTSVIVTPPNRDPLDTSDPGPQYDTSYVIFVDENTIPRGTIWTRPSRSLSVSTDSESNALC